MVPQGLSRRGGRKGGREEIVGDEVMTLENERH